MLGKSFLKGGVLAPSCSTKSAISTLDKSRKRIWVVRAEGSSSVHDDLLKEIEARRVRQAELLKKLDSLSTATTAIKVIPPPEVVEPAPEIEPDQPVVEPIGALPMAELVTEEPAEVAHPPMAAAPVEAEVNPNLMNVVMVGAECAPWSKTGGLGDVVGALPKALRRRGHRVMVVAPRYGDYKEAVDTGVSIKINMFNQIQEVRFFHAYIDEVDYVFIDHGCFRGRENDIYGGNNRVELMFRCSLLSKAAIEAVWHCPCGGVTYGDSNLTFIANDWHTAMLPVYLQAHYRDYGHMTYARSILVLHNMAHQGRAPFDEVHNLELNDDYKGKFFLDDPVGGEHMNVLKAGIICAQRLVAVSTGYAWECKTPEGGWGLHEYLNQDAWKLSGIVNGMDYNEWSPQTDKFLDSDGYTNFDANTLSEGKKQCKLALQRELGLPEDPDIPLLGFIGRLDYQKGIDLINDSYDWLTSQGVQLVFLGSGRQDLEDALRSMEARKPQQVKSWVGFSVKMAHRFTAGCDILMMPSRFEPCGLNQLYAMAYGTVPVVHSVGGLRDTVTPFNPFEQTGTGYCFDSADAEKMRGATWNALETYRNHKQDFKKLQLRGMAQDLSWDAAAKQYEDVMLQAKYQW